MYCTHCGRRSPAGAKFCPDCGAETTQLDASQEAQQLAQTAQYAKQVSLKTEAKLPLVIAGVIGMVTMILAILAIMGFGALSLNHPSLIGGGGVFLSAVDLLIAAAMLTGAILGFLEHPFGTKILWIACWTGCVHSLVFSVYVAWHPISRAAQIDFQVYPALVTIVGLLSTLAGDVIRYGIVLFLLWRLMRNAKWAATAVSECATNEARQSVFKPDSRPEM